ncbi:MAG: hypothetical protein ACYDC1_15715 [Limisphaerales bacterium]
MADTTPVEEGLKIPGEIVWPQERNAALAKRRARARYAREVADHGTEPAERAALQERGEKVGGQPRQASRPEPQSQDQYTFTNPQSRIMKAGCGHHFYQSNNAQAAVEVDSRLNVGQRVSQAPIDNQELGPRVAAIFPGRWASWRRCSISKRRQPAPPAPQGCMPRMTRPTIIGVGPIWSPGPELAAPGPGVQSE